MSHWASERSASVRVVSAVTVMPCEPVTCSESVIDTVLMGMPARRSTSTTVRASTSSNPSAKKMNDVFIVL